MKTNKIYQLGRNVNDCKKYCRQMFTMLILQSCVYTNVIGDKLFYLRKGKLSMRIYENWKDFFPFSNFNCF